MKFIPEFKEDLGRFCSNSGNISIFKNFVIWKKFENMKVSHAHL